MFTRIFTLIVILSYGFFGIAQSININSGGNTGTSGTNWSLVNGILTVSGAASVNGSVIQTALASGNLSIVGSTNALAITFDQAISVTTGGFNLTLGSATNSGAMSFNQPFTVNGKLTVYGSNVGLVQSITTNGDCYIKSTTFIDQGGGATTSTNGGDLIYWTATSAGDGYIRPGIISTNGGHVWIGGNFDAAAGTHIWHGHTVGGGYAFSLNYAGIGLRGNIDTRVNANQSIGGDVILAGESGQSMVGDIHAESTGRTIRTGNGAVVLMPYSLYMVDHYIGSKINIQTTGKIAVAPASGKSFWSGSNTSYNGTMSSSTFTGSQALNGIEIPNFTSIGGLELGIYSGTGVSGDTPYSNLNNIVCAIDYPFTIAGPIRIQGRSVQIKQNLQSTLSGAEIRVISRGISAYETNGWLDFYSDKTITTNNGNIILWTNAENSTSSNTSTANSELILGVNTQLNSNGGNIILAGGLDDGSNNGTANDGIPDGFSYRGGFNGQGLDIRENVIISSAGGEILMRGEGGQVGSTSVRGISSNNTLRMDAGTGKITMIGKSISDYGINLGAGVPNIALTSASTTIPAISITGTTTDSDWGINLDNSSSATFGNFLIQSTATSGGGIEITGTSGGNAGLHNRMNNGRTQILSKAGNITITATSTTATNGDFAVRSQSGFYIGERYDAVAVNGITPIAGCTGNITISAKGYIDSEDALIIRSAGSGSNVTLTTSGMSLGSGSILNATGNLVYEPISTSFTSAQSWPIANLSVASTLKGLRLGKNNNTANITVTDAQTIGGSIAIYGGQLDINNNLTATLAGSSLLLKASSRLNVSAGTAANALRTLQTNNGNLILWSNAYGGTSGGIVISDWTTLNSANGSTTQATGGGKVWLAGGSTVDVNTNLPTGPAIGTGNNISGISLGSYGSGSTSTYIYSGGGQISLYGEASNNNALGVSWNRSGVCNAGDGTIRILGDTKTNTGVHGVEIGAYSGTVNIISNGGDANNVAIYVKGTSERTTDQYTGIQTGSGAFKATGAGGIYIEGVTAAGNTTGSVLNIGMDILAASDSITIIANGPKDLRYIGTIGRKIGSGVETSSSNVLMKGNTITVNNLFAVRTTGTLTVEPNATSFTSAFTWPMTGFETHDITGLTLGKSGNAVSMTISSAQSIPGPITIYGGSLNLNANLTTTSTNSTASNISLNGTTISGTPTLTLATGSTLTMNLSSNTNFAGPIIGTNLGFVKNGAGTLSLTAATALNFVDFTISGGTYKLNSNQQLTLSNSLTNNGTFLMKSGATFVPSATVTNVTGTGTFTVEKLLTGNESNWNTSTNNGRFWYMGIPVNSAPRTSFGSHNTTSNRLFSYSETTKTYTSLEDNAPALSGGTGYVHRRTTNDTLTFTGVGANGLRGADFSQAGMTRTSGSSVGFHLVANPYMAYVDWDAVTKTNIESTYYIRSAATGNISALISYNSVGPNYVNGGVTNITTANDVRYLAPMQAFWVRVGSTSTTGSLGMNTGMLSHQTTNPGLKNTSIFPTLARVNLVDGPRFDQMLVFMNQDMVNGVDAYDSEKMFVSGNPQIYTMAAGKKLVMNGLNSNKKKISVPLYLELPESKVYNLQLADYNLEDGLILLEDKLEGTIQDFTIHDTYAFYANSGVLQNRFVLHFYAPDNGITAQGPSNSWIEEEGSYTEGGNILISSDPKGKVAVTLELPEDQKAEGIVQVTDANGRVVYAGALEGLTTEFQLNVPSGIYYLTVQSGNMIQNKKVFIQD